MKKIKQGLLVFSMAVSTLSIACTENGTEGFLPENNLKIGVEKSVAGTMTEVEFNDVITKVETIYAPLVSSLGGTLKVIRKWTDGTVNAYAQQFGTTWQVSMFGGLARHETITQDGLSLVVCHEIGHHIGGAPKKISPWSNPWASNEGQADYFANLKCLRRVWLNDDNAQIISTMKVPEALTKACRDQFQRGTSDTALCIRGGMAGLSVAKLFQALAQSPEPKFETPDTKVVSSTNDNHPATQCRLDTYFQGSLCEVSFNEDVSNSSEVTGTCHGSLNHKIGKRPLCWFKPLVQ